MKKLFRIIMIVCVSLFVNSCYYDTAEDDLFIPDEGNGTELSYQNDIIPLWSQCVGCHRGDEPPDLRDNVSYDELLNGYVIPGDPEGSILYKSLLGIDGVSLMPPGAKWPNSKIQAVYDWIDQGAKDN